MLSWNSESSISNQTLHSVYNLLTLTIKSYQITVSILKGPVILSIRDILILQVILKSKSLKFNASIKSYTIKINKLGKNANFLHTYAKRTKIWVCIRDNKEWEKITHRILIIFYTLSAHVLNWKVIKILQSIACFRQLCFAFYIPKPHGAGICQRFWRPQS